MNNKFWKHYFIFITIMLVIILSVLALLWTYLYAYENSRPEYTAKKVSNLFQKSKVKKITKYTKFEGKYNTKESIQKVIKNDLKDANITFEKKSGEYKNNKPVYSILNDGKEIAILKLKKSSQKGMFNTSKWNIKLIDYDFKKESIIVITKPDEKLLINGIELSKEEITDDNYYPDSLKNVLSYVNVSPFIKYEIEDVYENADIKYEGTYQKEDNTYIYKYSSNEELLNKQKDFLTNWCKNYTKYVVNEETFGSISGSVVFGSPAYSFLRTVANTNIWLASHTPTEFSEFSFENMQMYNDDLYSVDIKYDYSFYVNNELKEYQTNLTLYLVNINGNWLIGDLTI